MIAAIIPVHNRREFTRSCLRSLFAQTFKSLAVIVVDDGSTDGTGDMIRSDFPGVTLIAGTGNLWWSRSINIGIQHALSQGADRIVTLNDDLVVEPDFMASVFRASELRPHAVICAAGFDFSNRTRVVQRGVRINWYTAKNHDLALSAAPVDEDGFVKCEFLPARGLFVPKEVFERIGLFDSARFPQCGADYDFSWNASRAGFGTFCCEKVRVFFHHAHSGLRDYRRSKSVQNFVRFLTSRRSSACLRYRWRFAMKNCPKRALPFFFVFDTVRTVLSYFKAEETERVIT